MEEFQAGLNEIAHRFYLVDEEKKKYLLEREKQLKACQKSYKDTKIELQLELVTAHLQRIDRTGSFAKQLETKQCAGASRRNSPGTGKKEAQPKDAGTRRPPLLYYQ